MKLVALIMLIVNAMAESFYDDCTMFMLGNITLYKFTGLCTFFFNYYAM